MKLITEPGRLIAGNAGVLVTETIYRKEGEAKNFVIVDAAMNDLIRPTLYEAHHEIGAVSEARQNGEQMLADIVGPVCETGDYLARDREMPKFEEGDLLAVYSAGAYGATQSAPTTRAFWCLKFWWMATSLRSSVSGQATMSY